MKRLKKSDDDDDEETVDRLSSLPESLIFEILSFLETKDVVRTSLLSKEWKDVWTTIPYLQFNDSEEKPVQTLNLINGVLQGWKGTKILRFTISLPKALFDESLSKDMDRCVAFAVEKKVVDLHVNLPYYSRLEPPECLHSCSSITKLWLIGFNNIPTERVINMQWDRLKFLMIYCRRMNEEFLHQLFYSAPQLQVFNAYLYKCSGNINIRSSCLKRLSLFNVSRLTYTTLTICAPNLQVLRLAEYRESTCVVLDAPALTYFHLGHIHDIDHVQIHEESLKQLFLSIQHVKTLALPLSVYKWLIGVMKGKCLFSNVKIIMLCGGRDIQVQPRDISCPADLFPNVEKLLIVWNASFKSMVTLFPRHDFGDDANNPKSSFLLQLRRVEVIWCQSDHNDLTYEFMKLLLKDAIMVEKVVIIKAIGCVLGSEERTTQKMLSLRDSFPTLDILIFS